MNILISICIFIITSTTLAHVTFPVSEWSWHLDHAFEKRGNDQDTCAGLTGNFAPSNNTDMDTCCWYDKSTCCGTSMKPLLQVFDSMFHNISSDVGNDACFFSIADIFCSFCAPNTADFVSMEDDAYTICLTQSFCDSMYDNCQNDLEALNIGSASSGTQFCQALFLHEDQEQSSDQFTVNIGGQEGCYDGISENSIESYKDQCLPKASSSSSGGTSWFMYAIYAGVGGLVLVVIVLALIWIIRFRRKRQIDQAFQPFESDDFDDDGPIAF